MQKLNPKRSWSLRKRPLRDHRQSSAILGRDGKKYMVSINPNGMIGIRIVPEEGGRVVAPERLRYVDDILLWMIGSAKAANKTHPPPAE